MRKVAITAVIALVGVVAVSDLWWTPEEAAEVSTAKGEEAKHYDRSPMSARPLPTAANISSEEAERHRTRRTQPEVLSIFNGYGCTNSFASGAPSCKTGGTLCSTRRPRAAPMPEWITRIQNREYARNDPAFDWPRYAPQPLAPHRRLDGGSEGDGVPHFDIGSSSDSPSTAAAAAAMPANNSSDSAAAPTAATGDLPQFLRPDGWDPEAQWSVSASSIPVLGFVVSKGAALLKRGLLSVDYPVDKLVVVQMGENVAVSEVLADLKENQPHLANLHIVKLPNLGCAAGWNRVILEDIFAPYWFILNFDIAFPPGALAGIHANASWIFGTHERIGMVHLWYQWGGYKPEWSAFLLRRETVHDIGFFDENNWPVKHEDFDYSVRMTGSPIRQPWYRHLLPYRYDDQRCPDVYVYHGVGDALWGEGTKSMNAESAKFPGECKAISNEYSTWQRRRGLTAFSVNKWGDFGGPMVKNDCHDPSMVEKVKDVRTTSYWNHPTGADYYPPGVMWVPFTRPFGHSGMPAWFWVLDPHVRRCILGSHPEPRRVLTNHRQGKHSAPQRHQQGAHSRGGQSQATLPPFCRVSNVPYIFDHLSGLPEKCIDAFDLCVSSLTSLQNQSTLQALGVVPRPRGARCEEVPEKGIPLPPPLESHLGNRRYGCPTAGPPKGLPLTNTPQPGGLAYLQQHQHGNRR